MKMKRSSLSRTVGVFASLFFIVLFSALALAGEDSSDEQKEPSVEEIARELANPNTPLASLTFKNQYRLFAGELLHANDQHRNHRREGGQGSASQARAIDSFSGRRQRAV